MDCDKTEITSNKPEKNPARVEAGRNLANYNKRVKANQQQQPPPPPDDSSNSNNSDSSSEVSQWRI